MSSLQVQTPASNEPVTLAVLKSHLRVTISDDDDLLTMYLQGARELVESDSGRSMVSKAYRQSHDRFPGLDDFGHYGMGYFYQTRTYSHHHHRDERQMIKLLRCPLVSVTKISYIGTDGLSHDLAPTTDFIVDTDAEPPRLFPNYGTFWPLTQRVPNAVQIFYTAGYGTDGTNVPANLKIATMLCAGASYENREAVTPDQMHGLDWYDRLIWSERVLDYAPTK